RRAGSLLHGPPRAPAARRRAGAATLPAAAPTPMPTTAPMATAPTTAIPQQADLAAVFENLYQGGGVLSRALLSFPLPMALLSAYTAVPLFSAGAWALCPSPGLAARALAAVLAGLLGTATGAFLKRTKQAA
ncbi:unnamed protein product, partial [Prorocentrum cordatum]